MMRSHIRVKISRYHNRSTRYFRPFTTANVQTGLNRTRDISKLKTQVSPLYFSGNSIYSQVHHFQLTCVLNFTITRIGRKIIPLKVIIQDVILIENTQYVKSRVFIVGERNNSKTNLLSPVYTLTRGRIKHPICTSLKNPPD